MERNPKFLSLGNSYKLMKLLEEEYIEKNMTDADFAKYASTVLAAEVNADHIRSRRAELGIPNNRQKKLRAKEKDTMLELIRELEKRVAELEAARNKK